MLDAALSETNIDLCSFEVSFIKDLIAGLPRQQASDKNWIYEIVANKRNSVDVDKFDYIPRDCYYTGVKQSYDTNRLIQFARVVDDQICFNQKEVYNIYEALTTCI
jgi:deoxynucleoside triphosphate triphosphohydrolase SAMHD1